MKKFLGVLLLACALPSAALAQKAVAAKCQFVDPAVPITTSGTWCLRTNVIGHGITIDANDVVLDLRGYSIIDDGTATTPQDVTGNSVGVLSSNDNNITVRNGIIRGFDVGVSLGYPAGVRNVLTVEKLFVQGARKRGIDVLGYDSVSILDNVITGTGPIASAGINAYGRTDAYNNHVNTSVLMIMGNRVHDTRVASPDRNGWGHALGIAAWDASHTIIENNVITDVYNDSGLSGLVAAGIRLTNRFPYTTRIANNTIVNTQAAANSRGIYLGQLMGLPVYTGPMDYFGLVTGNRIQNFNRGVVSTATATVEGRVVPVVVYNYSGNVVSRISGEAYYGGRLVGNTNRIE